MPRVSKAEMIQNRAKIECNSSKLIKERGIKVSISDLMNASDLTHGGFYKHYKSKDELLNTVCSLAFNNSIEKWVNRVKNSSSNSIARKAIIEGYLSQESKNDVGNGCPISSVAIDISRDEVDQNLKKTFEHGVEQLLKILAQIDDSNNPKEAAIYEMSCMVGALILARATTGDLSDLFLSITKLKLIEKK